MTTPYLRRGPEPDPDRGRRVLIGVGVFFLLMVAFVIGLYLVIGRHNEGVKPPPPGPKPRITQTG